MGKRFAYMVQGRSDLIEAFRPLAERENADAYFLTYDKPVEGATHFPNSTWTEGRNRLLEEAQRRGDDYLYYVFLDDDIQFAKGDWGAWEAELLRYEPAVAIPILPKMSRATKPFQKLGFRYQAFLDNDEMMMAFHRDVVSDGLIVPYQTRFDHLNWWAACRIQEILIQNLYRRAAIQFNKVSVFDTVVERYDASDRTFLDAVETWLDSEFVGSYDRTTEGGKVGRLLAVLRQTMAFSRRRSETKPCYRLDKKKVEATFAPGSDLLARYRTSVEISPDSLQMLGAEV